MPRFSVIIVVYNRPALVRQAIDSVCAQTFKDREIIVVDDASSDETPEVLRTYGGEIRVVTQAHQQGCEVARNAGVAVAQGSYLAFLDSDDLYYPWALELYDFILSSMRQPALLVSRMAYFSTTPKEQPTPRSGDTIELVEFKDYLSRDRSIGSTCSMIVVRQDVCRNAGGFRQSTATTFNMSDHDFLLRVGCDGPAILLDHPRPVAYRFHPGNSVRNISRVVEGMLRIIKAERRGAYPGGRARWIDRRSAIGGPTMYWSRRALGAGSPGLAGRLFLSGLDMVFAKILKGVWAKLRGAQPTTRLEWTRRSPSPSSGQTTTRQTGSDF
jgi:glycosyltransferase involved in cell wall biosynthesis